MPKGDAGPKGCRLDNHNSAYSTLRPSDEDAWPGTRRFLAHIAAIVGRFAAIFHLLRNDHRMSRPQANHLADDQPRAAHQDEAGKQQGNGNAKRF